MGISTKIKLSFAAVLFSAIALQWTVSYTNTSGSPGFYTKAPSENDCSACHGSSSKSTKLTLTGAPTGGYVAGTKYSMTLSYSTSNKKNGFQITVLDSSAKKPTGTLAVSDKTNTHATTNGSNKRQYLTQTSAGSAKTSWTFDWTAPSSGTGTIIFYASFNLSNGNGNDDSGDAIYNNTFNIREGSSTVTPVADFTLSATSLCVGETLSVTDNSTNKPTSWAYTYNNGSSKDTNQNPSWTYSTAGTDTVTLIATNSAGSSSIVKKTVTINAKPSDKILINGIDVLGDTICSGDSTMITAASGGSTYSWSNGAMTQSIYVKKAGTYSVNVTNSSNCAQMSHNFDLVVNAAPGKPTLSVKNAKVCSGTAVDLTANAGTSVSEYRFFDGSGKMVSKQSTATYSFVPKASDSFYVITYSGCPSVASDRTSFSVLTSPKGGFSTTAGTKKNDVKVISLAAGNVSTTWNFGDGASAASDTGASLNHSYKASGKYKIFQTVKSANGCQDTLSTIYAFKFTGIDELPEGVSMKLYPNPSTGHINLEINGLQADYTISIRNILGQLILTEAGAASGSQMIHRISTESLGSGMYLMEIRSSEGVKTITFEKR